MEGGRNSHNVGCGRPNVPTYRGDQERSWKRYDYRSRGPTAWWARPRMVTQARPVTVKVSVVVGVLLLGAGVKGSVERSVVLDRPLNIRAPLGH